MISAATTGPDSPLWPITQPIYPERAESQLALLEAEEKLAAARAAASRDRYGRATRLLEEAELQVASVRQPAERSRLLAEVEEIRSAVPAGAGDRPGQARLLPSPAPPGQSPSEPGSTDRAQPDPDQFDAQQPDPDQDHADPGEGDAGEGDAGDADPPGGSPPSPATPSGPPLLLEPDLPDLPALPELFR